MMPTKSVWNVSVLLLGAAMLAGPAAAQQPAPAENKPATTPAQDTCVAPYGVPFAQKVQACTEAIQSNRLKGVPLGLAYYNRATAQIQQGHGEEATADYKEALRAFTEVIRVSQANAPLLFQRGLIYHTLGDADQAIVDYSDAIRLAPNETYAYVNRGIVLYTKKDNNEGAIHDFNSALKINKCEVNAWINRGLTYKRKGDLNQSIADFTEAIQCLGNGLSPVPTSPPARADAAYYQGVTKSTQEIGRAHV